MLDIRLLGYEFSSPYAFKLNMDLPSSTLRGAFGYALQDALLHEESLPDELDRWRLFRDLFAPRDDDREDGHTCLPRPFVIRGGFLDPACRHVAMELLLFGEAARFESLVDHVVQAMARRGLGTHANSGAACEVRKCVSEDAAPHFPEDAQCVCIHFLSPTRIKAFKQWWHHEIPFDALASRLCDRFAELVRSYGRDDGRDWLNWSIELKRRARGILSICAGGERFHGRRISSRTGDSCALNGFVGQMLYQGNFEPFSEILAHLPFIHVGKSAPFGCGWTEFCDPNAPQEPGR